MTLHGPSDYVGTGNSSSYVLPNAGFHIFPRSNTDEETFSEAPVLNQPRGSFGSTPGITISQLDGQSVIINPNPYEVIDRISPASVHTIQKSSSHGRLRRNTSASRLNANTAMNPGGVSRSQSLRTSRRPQSHDSSQKFRQRIASIPCDITTPPEVVNGSQRASSNHSLPLPADETDYTRLRNFSVTSKGVINRGDSFRSKSRSSHSVQSNGSGQRIVIAVHQPSPPSEPADDNVLDKEDEIVSDVEKICSLEPPPVCSSNASNLPNVKYRVLVVGSSEVGKTALTLQFTTSEYICSYDPSHDERNENSVTVILNGEESELVFIEHQYTEDMRSLLYACNPDAILVIYSVTNKTSFQQAKCILNHVSRMDDADDKAIILVGNKIDLVRLRTITTEDGRTLAKTQNSKFIETSVGINHNVDELLAGIVSQIRLKVIESEKHRKPGDALKGRGRTTGCPSCKARGIIKRILKKACSRSKSCDNLHVL